MKNRIKFAILGAAILLASACQMNQAEASGTYIAAEVATAAILQSNPALYPTLQLLVTDWNHFQLGTITQADEIALLQQVVAATNAKISPTQAALLDGAVQQVLANRNSTAPTPLSGAAGAIITDVMNGVGRELSIYQAPASAPKMSFSPISTEEKACIATKRAKTLASL